MEEENYNVVKNMFTRHSARVLTTVKTLVAQDIMLNIVAQFSYKLKLRKTTKILWWFFINSSKKMMNTDNTIDSIYKYLNFYKYEIDKEDFVFQLKSHPDFPSILSFSDALSFLNIRNKVFSIRKERIVDLPTEFVALLKNREELDFFFIKKEDQYKSVNKTQKVSLNENQINERWGEIVIIIEPSKNEESTKINRSNGIMIWIIALTFILLPFVFISKELVSNYLLLFNIIGIILSIEAIKIERGLHSIVSNKLCNSFKNSSCEKVINSRDNALKNIKFGYLSGLFFLGQSLFLLLETVGSNNLSGYISVSIVVFLAIFPITLYSIYFQKYIAKTWCPICLLIIGTVYLKLFCLLLIKGTFDISFWNMCFFIISYSIIGIFIFLIQSYTDKLKKLKENEIRQNRIIRNYYFFKNYLIGNHNLQFEKQNIILGNRKSLKQISIVTSPFCKYCESSHLIIDDILSKYGEFINVSIRFNFYDDSGDDLKKFLLRMNEIYYINGEKEFKKALDFWFDRKDIDLWFNNFGKPIGTIHDSSLLDVANENIEKNLNFTPYIFLNGYPFPREYDISDLKYMIPDWIEDFDV